MERDGDSSASLDAVKRIWYPRGMAKKGAEPPKKRGKERASISTRSSVPSSNPGRLSKGDLQIIGTHLPAGYFRLLDEEATRLGVGRRELLLLLHRRRRREMIIERAPDAPKAVLRKEELQVVKPYKWPLTAEQRKTVDEERLSVGIPSIAMYIIVLLCDWFGLPVFSPSLAPTEVRDDTEVGRAK